MKPYADTNFFTRLYLGGEQVFAVLVAMEQAISAGRRLPISWLHRIEVPNAIELSVFVSRAGGRGRVTPGSAAAAQARFREDCVAPASPLVSTGIEMDRWERQAQELILRHSARRGFRTYDILHISAALLLGCDAFWSYDGKSNRLARLEGLATLPDPA